MRTIAKAAIAAGFFCWAAFATGPLMAQGPYCYFDPKFNARVCIPDQRYYRPEAVFSFLWTRLFRRSNLLSSVWNLLSRRFHSSEPRMHSDWLVALLRHREVVAGRTAIIGQAAQ